jgi:hypothetical protein
MERRRAIRTRTYQPARVSLAPTDEDTYFCIVHNRTDFGFCIELTFDAVELPHLARGQRCWSSLPGAAAPAVSGKPTSKIQNRKSVTSGIAASLPMR